MPVVLDMRDPTALNAYKVKKITGLDAEEIFSKFYRKGSDGETFNLLTMKSRQIVMTIGLNPNYALDQSYSSLRDGLYKIISSGRSGTVDIALKNGDEIVAIISGFVSKVNAPLFNKNQEIELTINCNPAVFRSYAPHNVSYVGLGFTDAVVTDTGSTAPHGYSFELEFTSSAADLTITDPTDTNWQFKVIYPFVDGDRLFFSSEENRKRLYLLSDGATIDILGSITSDSIWPIFFPGENHISLSNSSVLVWRAFSYYETYWGV